MNQITHEQKVEVRSFIQRQHSVNLRDTVLDAQDLVESKATPDQVKFCEAGILEKYRGLLAYVRQQYQSETEKAHDKFDAQMHSQNRKENEGLVEELKDRRRIAEAERRRFAITYAWNHYWLKVVLEIICLGAETCYNAYAFTTGGANFLFSLVPALVVSIALCAIAIQMGGTLRDQKDDEQFRTIRRYGGWMFIAFVALGALRSFATIGNGTFAISTETLIGMCAYIIINAVIFAGAVIIAIGLPSKEDRLAKRDYDSLSKQIGQVDASIKEIHENENRAWEQAQQNSRNRISIVGEQSHLESLIENLCRQTIAAFYKELAFRNPQMRFNYPSTDVQYFTNTQNQ